ncbi:hypothetical protein [uncultured Dokdonia sp.]|uniref:hypothetical protein n=1 Tax=uncultured Dokdonia sp. TaxID=575653 RepID=UPI002605D5F4|nr:hypothetical protein [uncultured Dokdonia sp.]
MKNIFYALIFLGSLLVNAQETPVNPDPFVKDEDAIFLLKSKTTDVGVWLDPTEWSYQKAKDNPDAEYELQLKGEDLYGMIISETLEIPTENLKEIALENGREVAPDLEVVQEEYRTVNGQKVLFLQLNGTLQGIKFTYYGYYYSSPEGTVQFITYTSQGLLKSYIEDCENILNGLVKL